MDPALFDKHAEIETTHWWFSARRQIVSALIAECVPGDGGRRIVDVGCGTGANVAALDGAYACAGIDPTVAAVEYAQRRFPSVRFIAGDAPRDLGDLAGADAYLLMDVLEHVEDDVGLLRDLVETLESGGHVLITVPADMRLWSEQDVVHQHYRRYDTRSLRAVWADLPVEEVSISYFNARLYPIVRVARALSRLRGGGRGVVGSDLKEHNRIVNTVLRRVFGGEQKRILGALRGERSPYRRGVSLVAILRRT